jgi:hypothetical protein
VEAGADRSWQSRLARPCGRFRIRPAWLIVFAGFPLSRE